MYMVIIRRYYQDEEHIVVRDCNKMAAESIVKKAVYEDGIDPCRIFVFDTIDRIPWDIKQYKVTELTLRERVRPSTSQKAELHAAGVQEDNA
jgi:hypothetical protein